MDLANAQMVNLPAENPDAVRKALALNGTHVVAIEAQQGPSGEYYVTAIARCESLGLADTDLLGPPQPEPGETPSGPLYDEGGN